jgi:hypothetical protein
MNKVQLILLISICCVVLFSTAQKKPDYNAMGQKSAVNTSGSVYYYGVDFSHVRISDGPKVVKGPEYSSVYPRSWIAYVQKEMPPVTVQKKIRANSFLYKQDEIEGVSAKVVPDFIIGTDYAFGVDTLKAAIKKYTVSQVSGTGLVLIPENFNKSQEKAMTWVVFFDIKTRDILWATKAYGKCKHMGYTAHWGSGIVDGFNYFYHHNY